MIDIALMGRAGSGKDTLAGELVLREGYHRVAFADPLREMAFAVDPIIGAGIVNGKFDHWQRLSSIVAAYGWDVAKRDYPEVRRVLQRLGLEGVRRTFGDDAWLSIALRKISSIRADGTPVVVTDVRFRNELNALRERRFVAVWISRPGVSAGSHPSEAELGPEDADHVVHNDSTPAKLYEQVKEALRKI